MKPACVVAFLFALAFKAGVSADTLRVDAAGTDVADAGGAETAEACQSGSLIQRLSSSHKVLSDTEATPAESLKKTPEIKEKKKTKKMMKKQKSDKQHSDFMAFLAEAKKDGPGHPEGSECEPAGALPVSRVVCDFRVPPRPSFFFDLLRVARAPARSSATGREEGKVRAAFAEGLRPRPGSCPRPPCQEERIRTQACEEGR